MKSYARGGGVLGGLREVDDPWLRGEGEGGLVGCAWGCLLGGRVWGSG